MSAARRAAPSAAVHTALTWLGFMPRLVGRVLWSCGDARRLQQAPIASIFAVCGEPCLGRRAGC